MDRSADILVVTTTEIEGRLVQEYLGIVSGEAVIEVARGRGMRVRSFARSRRSGMELERRLGETRSQAIGEMVRLAQTLGASGIIAVALRYTTLPQTGNSVLLIVTASGTAVVV